MKVIPIAASETEIPGDQTAATLPEQMIPAQTMLAQKQKLVAEAEFAPQELPDDISPLSYAQQRLWFLDRWNAGSPVYNIPVVIRLTGKLDMGALEGSLKEILRRHESLRTTFSEEQGRPIQRISDEVRLDLRVISLEQIAEEERGAEAERRILEESRRLFDLVQGPLFRATVLRLSADRHVVILGMHHIVTDGWSLGVLLRELGVLYAAFLKGEASPLAPLPIQYKDFAIWQRQWLQGEELEKGLEYWREQLEGVAVLDLPADRGRPAMQSYVGRRLRFTIPAQLTQGLKEMSRREGVTLYMALLAAFQVQLYRYSGEEDIAVGSPIANRNREELGGLIGFFVNTLVMRTNLGGDPSFRELLGRVREVALGAYGHQDVPFEKLVEELKPERDASRNPLFQVVMVLQNAGEQVLRLPELTVEISSGDTGTAMFDLTLELEEGAEGIGGNFEYNTDLYDRETIERMVGHFLRLLEGVVSDPGAKISEVPLMTEAERHQVLVEWNDTGREYPREKCVHELFEAQVERTPDAVAVVFDGEGLSYRELNARANRLAHYLRKRGVGPEALVGICMERSLEMV
ncbi:MAG TPA: condensation domain-containing protein, partial [Acidobacteriota bacterium]|nr:condensation domain-containing protein [Acidobacteriota bacterium]